MMEETLLGSGGDGNVYVFNELLCEKIFNDRQTYETERKALLRLKGKPNICQINSWCDQRMSITMTKYDGDLNRFVKRVTNRHHLLEVMIKQLHGALKAIQIAGIFHNDIAMCNIFYKEEDDMVNFYIGDFGSCRLTGPHDYDIRLLSIAMIGFIIGHTFNITQDRIKLLAIPNHIKDTLLRGLDQKY